MPRFFHFSRQEYAHLKIETRSRHLIEVCALDLMEHGCKSAIFLIQCGGFAMLKRRDESLPSFRVPTREQLYGGSKARQIARNEERVAPPNKSGGEALRPEEEEK